MSNLEELDQLESDFTFTRMEEEKGKLHCFCLKHPNPVCAQRHTQQ